MTQMQKLPGDPEVESLNALQAKRREELGIADEPLPNAGAIVSAQAAAILERANRRGPFQTESQRRADAERQEKVRRWQSLCEARGSRYASCRLESFECSSPSHKPAIAELTRHAEALMRGENIDRNVVLLGPPGTGKDHLMMGLAHAAIRGGLSPRWCQGQELWAEFRDAMSADTSERQIVDRYAHCGILMLSDPVPPRGAVSDFQATTLFRIIDARYSNMRPTWVTLNVANRTEAEERLGPQVVDRLSQDALVIVCNWPSFRSKKA